MASMLPTRVRNRQTGRLIWRGDALFNIDGACVARRPEACDCPVCVESAVDATRLACGHVFCRACIASWFAQLDSQKSRHTCPMCRADCIGGLPVPPPSGQLNDHEWVIHIPATGLLQVFSINDLRWLIQANLDGWLALAQRDIARHTYLQATGGRALPSRLDAQLRTALQRSVQLPLQLGSRITQIAREPTGVTLMTYMCLLRRFPGLMRELAYSRLHSDVILLVQTLLG